MAGGRYDLLLTQSGAPTPMHTLPNATRKRRKGADVSTARGPNTRPPRVRTRKPSVQAIPQGAVSLKGPNRRDSRTQPRRRKLPDTVLITTKEACLSAVQSLSHHERIAVDCEGVALSRNGRLCLVQISAPDAVYFFDLIGENPEDKSRAKSMFEEGGLKGLLENPKVWKVMHDCRHDSDALYHQYGVKLGPVIDSQVLFSVLRKARGMPEGLPVSMRTLLKKFAGATEEELVVKTSVKDSMRGDGDFWLKRPLTKEAMQYARLDVEHLLDLTDLLGKFTKNADENAWAKVIEGSREYVTVFRDDEDGPRKAQQQYEQLARVARRERLAYEKSKKIEIHQKNDPMRRFVFDQTYCRQYRETPRRRSRQRDGGVGTTVALNRVLFERSEITNDEVILANADYRAAHVREVLGLPQAGGKIRAGIIDEFLIDDVPVIVEDDLTVKFRILEGVQRRPPPPPSVSLILAVPRPKVLARLLPQIAAVGVRDVVLCNAYKVEKCYFDSFLLTKPEEVRSLLVEGISQCGVDCRLPNVTIEKRLKVFLEDRLQTVTHGATNFLIAQPGAATPIISALQASSRDSSNHIVIAIGPEGGWMPRELTMFEGIFGFLPVSLGDRILRTDAAVLILMGLINEYSRLGT